MQNINGLKAKIHIGKTQLALDEATYRALLERVTGKSSCAKMNIKELEAVLAEMKKQGFMPTQPKKGSRPSPRSSLDPMMRKIEALLAEGGLHWNYAHAMAKRMFGSDRVHWLSDEMLHKLVAALQIAANRKKRGKANE